MENQPQRMTELLDRVRNKSRSLYRRTRASVFSHTQNNFELGSRQGEKKRQGDSAVAQAKVVEVNLDSFKTKNWRKHFASRLSGEGLEIGPLHRPLETHAGMRVKYIDRFSVADLRSHYPELNDLPLVEPDILGDAATLEGVESESFDFLVSAHVIEHMPDPVGSLKNWLRVIKNGGLLYLIVPDKRAIFDKNRMRTTLEHLILDYEQPSLNRDFEHFLDYAIHVHGKEGQEAIDDARKLVAEDYSIHFHVFIPTDIVNLLEWVSENVSPLEIIEGPSMSPGSDEFHFLIKKV